VAWSDIYSLGGINHSRSAYEQGYIDAINEALEVIERLGGQDTVCGGDETRFVRVIR
jgi:hypothetical protein